MSLKSYFRKVFCSETEERRKKGRERGKDKERKRRTKRKEKQDIRKR